MGGGYISSAVPPPPSDLKSPPPPTPRLTPLLKCAGSVVVREAKCNDLKVETESKVQSLVNTHKAKVSRVNGGPPSHRTPHTEPALYDVFK